jgi:hypothetical protein
VEAVAEATSAETTKAEIAEVEAVAEATSAETTKAEIPEVEAVAEATSAETTKAEIAEVVATTEVATTEVAKAVIEGPRAAIVVRNPVIRRNPATGDPRAARTQIHATPSKRAEIPLGDFI